MAKANDGVPQSPPRERDQEEWQPTGGLVLSGRVVGRTSREIRVGEEPHTVYTYKVLAGTNILWLEIWDGKAMLVGTPIKREVEVRAYAGKGGASYRLVVPKEETPC